MLTLAFYLMALQPRDLPLYIDKTVAPIQLAYDADPEELEAESTRGSY